MKKNILRALLVLLVVVMIPVVHGEYVKAEYKKAADSELPLSTMKVYKDMDTSFLKTFSYGCTYDGEVSVYMHTAAQMI